MMAMLLSSGQIEQFDRDGVLVLDQYKEKFCLDNISLEVEKLSNKKVDSHVYENDGETLRAMHGCHLYSDIFKDLGSRTCLADIAKQILNSQIYIYQFKINMKSAFTGDSWWWHQDFEFWNKEDGMSQSKAINVVLFLDDIVDINGPLYFFTGSHKTDLINYKHSRYKFTASNTSWKNNVSANLRYTINNDDVVELSKKHALVPAVGEAGTILVFHGSVVHASPQNISPFSRRMVIITYNPVSNAPARSSLHRPDFLVTKNIQVI